MAVVAVVLPPALKRVIKALQFAFKMIANTQLILFCILKYLVQTIINFTIRNNTNTCMNLENGLITHLKTQTKKSANFERLYSKNTKSKWMHGQASTLALMMGILLMTINSG